MPVEITVMESAKMLIALFYRWQQSRLLAEITTFFDSTGDDSGVNLKEATVSASRSVKAMETAKKATFSSDDI
jgi:hypothetical protein